MAQVRRRSNRWILGALLVAGVMLAASFGESALTRTAGRLGLACVAIVSLVTPFLPRRVLAPLTAVWWLLGLVCFAALAATTLAWGGSALNGRGANGSYYLMEHGHQERVGRGKFYTVATVETLVFVLWPSGLVLVWLVEERGEGARRRAASAAEHEPLRS